jgi:hypothetical protein
LLANERWWREPRWLKQVASAPVELAAMDRGMPETMPRDEAALFSARAAALVSCAAQDHPDGLAGFVEELRVAASSGEFTSRFADLADPSNWSECLEGL